MPTLPLRDILTRDVFTVSPDTALTEVLKSMESRHISCVIAVDENTLPLGIFTEQDAIRLMADRKVVSHLCMADAMSAPPLTAPLDMDFRAAFEQLSQKNFRHMIVVDNSGKLAGIVSEADFLHHMGMEFLVEIKTVSSVMSHKLSTLDEDATLADAVDCMAQQKISCIVIAQGQKPLGIVTERDAVRFARTIDDPTQVSIVNVMKSPVQTIDATFPLLDAIKKMETLDIRRLIVTKEGLLAGIVTRHDIVKTTQGRYIEFLHEVLERQRNELIDAKEQIAITRQKMLYHSLMEQINDTVIVSIADSGIIVDCNDQACRDFGYTREELLALTIFDLATGIAPGPLWDAELSRIRSLGKRFVETQHRRRDGSLFTVEISAQLIQRDGGEYIVAVTRDLTERKAHEAKILASEKTYRNILNQANETICILDEQHRFLDINIAAENTYGYSRSELLGKTPEFLYDPQQTNLKLINSIFAAASSGIPQFFEFSFLHKDGTRSLREVSLTRGEYFEKNAFIVVTRDITERKRVEEKLREMATVMECTHEGVVITDKFACILATNQSFCQITGYSADEVIGANISLLSSGRQSPLFYQKMWDALLKYDFWQGEIWNRRKNGELYPQLLTISTVKDENGQAARYIGVFADITQLKESQAELEFMAHHDPLTKLPNRALVEARMTQEIEQAHRQKHRLSVLFIDLDRFKQVNDSFGHLVGDELLQAVGERLRTRLREGDTLGRLGGDEFILLSTPLHDSQDAAVIARDILVVLSEPFKLSTGHEVFIGGSIGISLFPDNGTSVSELTKNADAAMYKAKENGRNQFSFYTATLNADARNKLELENDLRRAMLHNELSLHFQPKVDMRSGKICGAEALARWHRDDGHWVPPAQFIPLAEKSGLILVIGNWVIEQTCLQLRNWLDAGMNDICVAINVSARQFRSGHIDRLIKNALTKFDVPAACLEVELTETMLMHEPEQAIETMRKLKQIGVRISLDDFGTGYSNFSYLRRFPIDCLKVDQSFVHGVVNDAGDAEITSTIISIAHRLKLRVVAEGVENTEQLAFLRANECDELQGFYFSKPLPAWEFFALLTSGKTLEG